MSKPKTFNAYKQGIFRPINTAKCLNKGPVIFRSSLEQKLMRILDANSNIMEWSSELVIIPYKHPVKSAQIGTPQYARYFVDFFMKIKTGDTVKEFIIEIKPDKQTRQATKHGNKKNSTLLYEQTQFSINTSKWEAAKKWCEDQKRLNNRDINFLIITEKNIDTILTS